LLPVKSGLATGYVFGPAGPKAVPDREWIGPGAGNIYSTTRDMARYVVALVGGGANEHGRVLKEATLTTMFEPHFQPDPRIPGMGLGFVRSTAGEHRVVEHEGILPGFNSALFVAPDDGVGLIAFTNGSSGAMSWMPTEFRRILHNLLGLPDEVVRGDLPHHPEVWDEICGWYRLPPRISDLRGRMMMAGGVQVFVRGGQLMLRVPIPVPALSRGLPLHPDDAKDPYVFRIDLSRFGMSTVRIVFGHEVGAGTTVVHTDLGSQPLSFTRRPDTKRPPTRLTGALAALALAAAVTAVRRRRTRSSGMPT
jgi:Beta-lactamase